MCVLSFSLCILLYAVYMWSCWYLSFLSLLLVSHDGEQHALIAFSIKLIIPFCLMILRAFMSCLLYDAASITYSLTLDFLFLSRALPYFPPPSLPLSLPSLPSLTLSVYIYAFFKIVFVYGVCVHIVPLTHIPL